MEKNLTEELKNRSESFFLVPFYYPGKKAFEKCINTNWVKEQGYNHWFLAKHIDAFDKGEEQERIFTYFTLNTASYGAYGLPKPNEEIRITSDLIVADDIMPEQFTMRICRIKLLYFNTGFGFLIYQVDHQEDDIETIANKSFSLLRAFVSGRKSGKQVRLSVMEAATEEGGLPTERELNISSISNQLLEISGKHKTELFPTSCKNQCYVYHRLLLGDPISEEEAERYLLILRKGFHIRFVTYEDEKDSVFDYYRRQNKNIYWGGSIKGVVSLSHCIPGEDNYFVTGQYPNNVRNDYFLLYMILLHQRQVLLHYNYIAVKEQNSMKKLEYIKKELIRFRINFAYKTVSDEASYQRFYLGMYDCLSLESLNGDIQDVIDRVTEYQDFSNEKSMNRVLALIAMFSIFSALADGLGFAEILRNGLELTWIHVLVLVFILIVLLIAVITYIKKIFKR